MFFLKCKFSPYIFDQVIGRFNYIFMIKKIEFGVTSSNFKRRKSLVVSYIFPFSFVLDIQVH